MIKDIIKSIKEMSKGISFNEIRSYSGIYQWRQKNGDWLFDIEINNKFSIISDEPSKVVDYMLSINIDDLGLLINKRIDPLGVFNSNKIQVTSNISNVESNNSHIQKLLNFLINGSSINSNINNLLEKYSMKSDDIGRCPKVVLERDLDVYLKQGSPCLVENSLSKEWSLYKLSENEILSKVGSDYEIITLLKEYDIENNIAAEYGTTDLSAYVDSLSNGGNKKPLAYMAANTLPNSLSEYIEYPSVFRKDAFNVPRWWIGPKNTGLALHRDLIDNFLYQLKGIKRIYLFSPSESKYLYPTTIGGNQFYEPSPIDIFNPDLNKYPKYSSAKHITCDLNPGEMLYIPAGWWHCVKNVEISWSVNYFAVNQTPYVLNEKD